MSQLHPCPECQRHIRADETACPFCQHAASAPAPRRLPVGRFTRAAVFAGALAGSAAIAGCGSTTPTPEKVDVEDERDTGSIGGGGGEYSEPVSDAGVEGPGDIEDERRVPDHDIPMPYGAPPARSRLV